MTTDPIPDPLPENLPPVGGDSGTRVDTANMTSDDWRNLYGLRTAIFVTRGRGADFDKLERLHKRGLVDMTPQRGSDDVFDFRVNAEGRNALAEHFPAVVVLEYKHGYTLEKQAFNARLDELIWVGYSVVGYAGATASVGDYNMSAAVFSAILKR